MSNNKQMINFMSEAVLVFMAVLNQIKIYHWQTELYARHIASDNFYTKLSANVDRFIEIVQGKYGRVVMSSDNKISLDNQTDNSIITLLSEFKKWIIGQKFMTKDSDLATIRDDILADINQTMYLFSFN